jgi:hypothetical protein
MQTKTAKVLPKTAKEIKNGGLYLQRVRCGKTNCKCARGELHSAFYFFTRRNGKLVKIYVRKGEIENFSRLIEQSYAERMLQRSANKTIRIITKNLYKILSDNDTLIRLFKEDME